MIPLALLIAPFTVAAAEPLLRVDTLEVPREAFIFRAAAMRAAGQTFSGEQFLEASIDEAVLVAEARRTGFARDPEVRLEAEQAVAKALAEALAREKLAAAVTPTEAELLNLFHQGADMVRLEQVIVATKEEAEKIKARLLAGGEFALEATRSLESKSGRNKGDTGRISRREMAPALATPAFAAPIGELFGPVALPLGFAVARVVERSIADEKEYPARRAVLLDFSVKQGVAAAKRHLAEKLRAKHKATVDEKFLESIGKRTDASPSELDTPFATIAGKPIPYRLLQPRIATLAGPEGSGHMKGSRIKIQVAWSIVDERLLAIAAREAGLESSPTGILATGIAENQAIASAMANRLRRSAPSGATAAEVEAIVAKRVKQLRKELSIKVDREAAIRAAGNPR